ncbi:MAG: hypothetical protein GEV10_25220 [Streptosporangiales bacterium]|nr:hypothetical protein [Streptosporangiales bacterium]
MSFMRRLGMGIAATGVALLTAGVGAGVAHADGPDTTKRTVTTIEGAPWVTLDEGDRNYRVAAVRCFLDQLGYFEGCDPTADLGDLYTPELTAAVEQYQVDRDLPISDRVDTETWATLRTDVGVVERGDSRTDTVKGLQYALTVLDEPVDVDGLYGSKTEHAVEAFQERKEIGVDGDVGPLTFRAMFAKGAQQG